MTSVSVPIFSGVVLALGAVASQALGSSLSTSSAAVGATAGVAAGVASSLLGNWAANGIQGGALEWLKRISDDSVDPSTGLPRNHDVQRASCDALRAAASALVLQAAGELDPKKPWIPAIAAFFRDGRFRSEPLIAAFDRPDQESLQCLRDLIAGDRFAKWHDGIRVEESDLVGCFKSGACSLSSVLPAHFKVWLEKELGEDKLLPNVVRLIEQGWHLSGELLRFEDIYCLFFREHLKKRPEVFRIFIADAVIRTE